MTTKAGDKDISDEFEDVRERLEQEIRDIDKNMGKLTKRKAALQEHLGQGQTEPKPSKA